MGAHSHPIHEMIVVLQGAQRVLIEGARVAASSGDVLFYPARVPHEEWSEPGSRLESFFIAFEWGAWRPELPLKVRDERGRIREAASWLYDERESSSAAAGAFREGVLRAILAEFMLRAASRAHALVERVRAHAADRLRERLGLDELARCAGLSKYHFVRRYKALTGLTPVEDLRRMRLEAARGLLVTTDLPLKAIAPQVGLGDEYHLSRLFRRQFGICARELRRRAGR